MASLVDTPIPLAARDLSLFRAQIAGTLFLRDDTGYAEALRGWNNAITQRPALIVQARSAQDVAQAIAFARDHALGLSIRSGGHNAAGLGYCDDGVMIDLGQMNAISVDSEQRVARAQPGARLGAFVAATQAHGLATNTGTSSHVGLGGSTLGGGLGWLEGRYGLTIDSVLAFELVTVDGRILTASATDNPDLFWALRGGGGNFGVVTEMTYQLHPVTTVYGGMVVYSMDQAHTVLRAFVDLSASAPDELMIQAILTLPPGAPEPIVMLHCCYCGDDPHEGERVLAPIRQLGQPIVDTLQVLPYGKLFALLDPPAPVGFNYYDTASTLRAPSDAALATIITAARQFTRPFGAIAIHQMRGAAARVAPDATAFALREPHFIVLNTAMWAEGSGDSERAWADATLAAMAPFASAGLNVNFMSHGDEAAVRASYRDNYARLAALKQHYDPENVLCLNQNIIPATRGT